MSKLLVAVVFAWVMVCLTGCASKQASSLDQETEIVTYEVFGTDCPAVMADWRKTSSKYPAS